VSFEAIKEQAAMLEPTERRRLMAFLVSLDDAQMQGYRAKLREKIDDNTPGRWLTLEQLDDRLGLRDATE
jgi:hypothetical protein